MRPGKLKILFLYAAICFIWGSTWLGIKLGLDGVPALLGAAIRFSLASLIFLPAIGWQGTPFRVTGGNVRVILVVGISNFGISYGLVYWSEMSISSGLASVLFCAYPLFVALLAHRWLKLERLHWKTLAGIVTGFLGIVWIYADQIHRSTNSLQGMLAVLAAALASSVSLVYLKKHGRELNTLVLNFYAMLTGSTVLWTGFFVFERGVAVHWSLQNAAALLYLTIAGSVVAFTIYFYLLKHLTATQMSFVTLICPVLALLLGAGVLQEQISKSVVAGSALVLLGIFIANRAASSDKSRSPTLTGHEKPFNAAHSDVPGWEAETQSQRPE